MLFIAEFLFQTAFLHFKGRLKPCFGFSFMSYSQMLIPLSKIRINAETCRYILPINRLTLPRTRHTHKPLAAFARIKALWLETSESWLRYGRAEDENGVQTADELLLLKYFRMLPPEKQQALIMLLHEKES